MLGCNTRRFRPYKSSQAIMSSDMIRAAAISLSAVSSKIVRSDAWPSHNPPLTRQATQSFVWIVAQSCQNHRVLVFP